MENQWQPIETAPKDGTRILAYFPYETRMYTLENQSRKKMNQEMFKILTISWNGNNWRLDPDGATEFEFEFKGKPTHWMPLPPKPPIINLNK